MRAHLVSYRYTGALAWDLGGAPSVVTFFTNRKLVSSKYLRRQGFPVSGWHFLWEIEYIVIVLLHNGMLLLFDELGETRFWWPSIASIHLCSMNGIYRRQFWPLQSQVEPTTCVCVNSEAASEIARASETRSTRVCSVQFVGCIGQHSLAPIFRHRNSLAAPINSKSWRNEYEYVAQHHFWRNHNS